MQACSQGGAGFPPGTLPELEDWNSLGRSDGHRVLCQLMLMHALQVTAVLRSVTFGSFFV
jgi:hypothetical protein